MDMEKVSTYFSMLFHSRYDLFIVYSFVKVHDCDTLSIGVMTSASNSFADVLFLNMVNVFCQHSLAGS